MKNCDFFNTLIWLKLFASLEGAICLKSNSLSYESWLILSLEPYLLKFHCTFNVKEFFLETCPRGDFIGGEIVCWLGDRASTVAIRLVFHPKPSQHGYTYHPPGTKVPAGIAFRVIKVPKAPLHAC